MHISEHEHEHHLLRLRRLHELLLQLLPPHPFFNRARATQEWGGVRGCWRKIEDELNDDLPLEGDDDGVDDEVRSLANGVAALKTSCLTFWCVGNRSWTGTMSSAIRP